MAVFVRDRLVKLKQPRPERSVLLFPQTKHACWRNCVCDGAPPYVGANITLGWQNRTCVSGPWWHSETPADSRELPERDANGVHRARMGSLS